MLAFMQPLLLASFYLPFRLEYFTWWTAGLLFLVLGIFVVWLGLHSLTGMTGVRRWVIIVVRLEVLLVLIMLLGGLRWQRRARDVEVYCLRDASDSTTMVQDFPGRSLQRSLDDYFIGLSKDPRKKPDDTIGVIGFRGIPLIEAMPMPTLSLDGRGTPVSSSGTDVAAALQLAMASMSPDTMHRILLAWDGNQTVGDVDAAVAQAASMHIPIDVMPLHYDLKNEIMLERIIAPSWRRENEPFALDVYLRSTNDIPVHGQLTVLHETRNGNVPITERPIAVTLKPGLNHEMVHVPALRSGGVHRFHAQFTPDPGQGKVDTIDQNNTADAFTVVRGKGEVLYVNNFLDSTGRPDETLVKALNDEKITLHEIPVGDFPSSLIRLQDYDAIILDNVPRGAGGISTEQDAMIERYVHEFGGGLVMIGGDEAFGAGGWLGSEVEKVLPVDMDIPAQRQVPKGALVLIMDPGEISEGRYWGEQCAFKAVEALSSKDEIGIVDFDPMTGRCEWVFPLQEKGDGSAVRSAIRKMQDGDMPSFEDALQLAMHGGGAGVHGLLQSDARARHIVIISDGDNGPPQDQTIQALNAGKITVSTITAYAEDPSNPNVPPVMDDLPKATHGKAYGPINNSPNQLPQIFIKEAQIVRRTLIHEDAKGIPIRSLDAGDELIRGMDSFDPLFGQVLVSKKNDPRVLVPLVSGKLNDPVLAHWQAGLGKTAAFTGDAHWKWGAAWSGSSAYSKFWAQVVRSVSRAPMSANFDVDARIDGNKGHIRAIAMDEDGGGRNFLSIAGSIVGPNMTEIPVRLNQTAPGVYEADFPANDAGTYVAGLHYRDNKGKGGTLMTGVSLDTSPEMRDLQSNDARLEEIRVRTGGRRIPSWDPLEASIFAREGLHPEMQSLPIWDLLLVAAMGLMLTDVAVRRIAWDWQSTKRMAFAVAERVRAFTSLRRGDTLGTLAALKDVRTNVQKNRTGAEAGGSALGSGAPSTAPPPLPQPRPDARARFTPAKGVEGDINELVAGAKNQPVPTGPARGTPKGAQGGKSDFTESLLDAKRRARQRMQTDAESHPPQGRDE